MEKYVYPAVNVICVVYILYRLWLFLFCRRAGGIWELLHRHGRIMRVIVRKLHKRRMSAEAKQDGRRRTGTQKKKREAAAIVSAPGCEVIGKTRSVYIPDPAKAKEPVRSEPLPESGFIGEDDEISADDVDDNLDITDNDLPEFTEPVWTEADSDFSQAMTYDDINNMVDAASGADKDDAAAARAVETLCTIRQSDIYEFILNESGNKDRIERLMRERFDSNGALYDMPEQQKKEVSGFDWSQYV